MKSVICAVMTLRCVHVGVCSRFVREQQRWAGDQRIHLVGSRTGQRLSTSADTSQSGGHLRRGHIPQASFTLITGLLARIIFKSKDIFEETPILISQVRGVESRFVERRQAVFAAAVAMLLVRSEHHVSASSVSVKIESSSYYLI